VRRWQLLAIFALALGVRVVYIVVAMRRYAPNSDALNYFALARRLAHGHGFADTIPFGLVHATAERPPLFPALLNMPFAAFGAHVGVAQATNVIIGAGVALLAALLADDIAGPRAGLAAGVTVALYPPLIANDVTVLSDSLSVLLTLLTCWLLVRGRTLLAAATTGLLLLDRASAQLLVLALFAWVWWRLGWRHALRFGAVALVVVAPWVVRNWVQVGGPVLVTTNGFNLNAQYGPEARADHDFVDAYKDPRLTKLVVGAANEVDLDNALRARATRSLRAYPMTLASVVGRNSLSWGELSPGRNTGPERLDGRNLTVRRWTLPFFYLVTAVGLGALVFARRSAPAQLLLIVAGYFTVASLVSVAAPRLRAPLDAAAAIGCGVAIAWLLERRTLVSVTNPPLRPARLLLVLGACAGLLVMLSIVGVLWRDHARHDARAAVLAAISRDGTVDSMRFDSSEARNRLPVISRADVSRLRDLSTQLLDAEPKLTGRIRDEVRTSGVATRTALRAVDALGLLSAAEAIEADRTGQPASLAHVRLRYDDVRQHDPSFPSWSAVMSGETTGAAQRAIEHLRLALEARS
jgi:hypothetical protein